MGGLNNGTQRTRRSCGSSARDSEDKIGQILFNKDTGAVLALVLTDKRRRYAADGFITAYCPSKPISAARIREIIEEIIEEERMIKAYENGDKEAKAKIWEKKDLRCGGFLYS